jgi:zinc D-Ala-D-Ala carboxypeptidase
VTTRLVRNLAALLVLLLALAGPGVAAAQPTVELERARERAAEIDERVARAEQRLADARDAVAALEAELRLAGAALAAAQAEQAAAEESAALAARRADRARADLATAEAQVEDTLDLLAAFASQTYKHGAASASPTLLTLRSLSAPADGADLADSLQAMRLGLREQRRIVEEAGVLRVRTATLAAAAEEEEAAEQAFLDEALAASDRAAEAHAEVDRLVADASAAEARRSDRLGELQDARRGITQRIADLEAEVAREAAEAAERARRAEQAAREQAAREQAARERAAAERAAAERRSAPAPRSSGGSSSGGAGRASSGGSTSVSAGPAPGLVTVGGITVAASLGPSLAALLDAARADGIVLGGSGYRSPDAQAALRRVNGCPDVWTSPASSCRVPTAIPGSSEHEKGLAVDFTYQGRTICFPRSSASCRGNPAFDWLRANAGRFGLRNLPSEAWHWSTTGR